MSVRMEMIAWECAAESPVQRLLLVKFGDASAGFISEINLSDRRIQELSAVFATSELEIREQIQILKHKGIIFPGTSERDSKPCWFISFHAVQIELGGNNE